jgi:type II secretory pathway pseudopilin PulG
MEIRTAGWSIAVIIIGGVGYLIMESFNELSLKNDLRAQSTALRELKTATEQHDKRLFDAEKEISMIREETESLNKDTEMMKGVEAALPKLKSDLEAAQRDWQSKADSMKTTLAQVREKFKDVLVPQIPLKNGTILTDCKLQMGKDGSVNFVHSAGVAKLSYSQLPLELADRLRPGWQPTLSLLPDPEALTPTPAADVAQAPPDQPAPPASPGASKEEQERVLQLTEKLKEYSRLQTNIVEAESRFNALMRKYYDHSSKASAARMNGQSSSQAGLAKRAKEEADGVRGQITAAYEIMRRLQTEVDFLRNPP